MVRVSDQFEIEPAIVYSGSYTDGIFSPGSIFDSTRFVVYSHGNQNTSARSFKDGFRLKSLGTLTSIFGKGFSLGLIDISYGGSIAVNPSSSAVTKENIVSPSQNLLLKQIDPNEQFADTVLPRPPDIYLVNGANFSEGKGEFIYPGGFYIKGDPTINLTSSFVTASIQPKKFVITLGSFGEATLTGSDSSQISDDKWAFSFPFEKKYGHLDKLLKPTFDKNYTISYEQVLSGSLATKRMGATDLAVGGYRHTSYQSNRYTLQYCFETKGNEEFEGLSFANKRRYVKLISVPTEVSNGLFKPTGSIEYPDLNFIYKGFYGFHKANNNSPPYGASFENSRSNPSLLSIPITLDQTSYMRFNGFGKNDSRGLLKNRAGFPEYDRVMGYTTWGHLSGSFGAEYHFTAVEDFNATYLRINGWKYGVYDALPRKTFCHWRRSRFGQLRDMLEQRPYTKFYDVRSGQALAAAVNIKFAAGTLAAITASNYLFNSNSSGIYDFEGKSGKPFADRDNED